MLEKKDYFLGRREVLPLKVLWLWR